MKLVKSNQKSWGILIYACGNNDLEPEITRSVFALNEKNCCKNVGVALQLARAPQEMIAMLRLNNKRPLTGEDWQGVRRYLSDHGSIAGKLLVPYPASEYLEDINMADPSSLSDFLVWAFSAIDARQYIVILSGHGAGFIGAMADLTHGKPQIMGIPQMAAAFKKSMDNTEKRIKLLIMDACYMNLVENIYEFALSGVADIFWGSSGLIPLEGYDYKKLIENLCSHSSLRERESLAKVYQSLKISKDIGSSGIVINTRFFKALKKQLSKMAERLMSLGIEPCEVNESEELLVDFKEMLKKIKKLSVDDVLKQSTSDILTILDRLWLQERNAAQLNSINIFCPSQREDFICLAKYYHSLKFSKDNFWPRWLAGDSINQVIAPKNSLSLTPFGSISFPLSLLSQHLLSLNPHLDIDEIYYQLGWVKRTH